jgi:hypothetical protein
MKSPTFSLRETSPIKFLKAFFTFVKMYSYGFYFSENTHLDADGTHWGFYRFNEKTEPALFDVDFSFDKKHCGYFHVHGDDFRLDIADKNSIQQKKLFLLNGWRKK